VLRVDCQLREEGTPMITVRHVLANKGHKIHSIGPDEPVLEAIRSMADHHIGALLVMRGDTLLGVISERDYARNVILRGRSSSDTPVSQVMTTPVISVTPQETVHDCMRLVTEQRIRHLPVMEDGRVTGVISIGDLVKAVMEDQQRTIEQLETYIRS
jgi:CBS domain-containing protein